MASSAFPMTESPQTGPGKRLVTTLLQLSHWRLALAFIVLAVAVSVGIVLAIDLAWDGRLNRELEFAGVVTPALDAALVMAIVTMILAELRAEAAQRERTEKVLKEAQRIAHTGNWTLDLSTGALVWSEELLRIFEVPHGPFVPSHDGFLQRVHPTDRERVDELHRRSLAGGEAFEITFRLLFADGRVKHVFERGATLQDREARGGWAIGTLQDITERVTLEEELRRLATTDALTGVSNRHRFNQLLGQELERTRRYRAPLSLIMFDIDHFKQVNDTLGHESGDEVLIQLARVVAGALRRSDVLARWGGDEFMVLAPHTRLEDAVNLAERLRLLVEQTPCGGRPVTISLGVIACTGEHPAQELLHGADAMLYRAKSLGRNRTASEVIPSRVE